MPSSPPAPNPPPISEPKVSNQRGLRKRKGERRKDQKEDSDEYVNGRLVPDMGTDNEEEIAYQQSLEDDEYEEEYTHHPQSKRHRSLTE